MSLQSALQRVNELRSLTGSLSSGSTQAAPDSTSAAAFSAMLQSQMSAQNDAAGLPGASMASGLPQLMPGMMGGTPGSSAMGLQSAGVAGLPPGMPTSAISGIGFPGLTSGGVGARMVQLAQGEIGVAEAPSGSNDSPRIRQYRSATAGAENTPGPWCAYFVSWLARNAGAPIGANGNGTGYVPTLTAWGRQTGRFIDAPSMPQPGDIIIFSRGGIPGHTGIVESVDGSGRVHTIEGNSSDRVTRRDYAGTSSEIIGYVRPG